MLATTHSVTIDTRLRQTLLTLEKEMSVDFDHHILEKIFIDAEEDQVSEKRYILIDTPSLHVIGHVEHYEPETISFRFEVASSEISKVRTLLATLFKK